MEISSFPQIVPGDLSPGTPFSVTSAHTRLVSQRETKSLRDRNIPMNWNVAPWWRKSFLPSAGRPDMPQHFRPAQFLSIALKRREAYFERNQ
jgi:hypothetical protein